VEKSSERKRIAFLGGGALFIPSYRMLLALLAQEYEIILYSEFHLRDEEGITDFKMRSVPSWMPGRVREIWFALMIFIDQFFIPADIIHSHSTYPSGLVGTFISKIFGKPVVVSLNAAEGVGIKSIEFGDLLRKRRTRNDKYVLRHAAVVVVHSEYHKALLEKNFKLRRELKVIARGSDLSKFKFSSTAFQLPIRFLNVGYLHPVKDQKTLLRSFAIISKKIECSLVHVGKDYSNGEIELLSKELGIRDKVEFAGFIPHNNIQHFYDNADILLHTSLYESQPVVVIEALASGVVVCGTHVGLLADLSDACCLTVAPGDYQALADKVLLLVKDFQLVEKLRTAGRRWAEQHDLIWTKNRWCEIYNSL
jgi:glycosyltransferase involved in cell wall biosynthesis